MDKFPIETAIYRVSLTAKRLLGAIHESPLQKIKAFTAFLRKS